MDKKPRNTEVETTTSEEASQVGVAPFGLRFIEAPIVVDASMTTPTGVTGTPSRDYDDDPS